MRGDAANPNKKSDTEIVAFGLERHWEEKKKRRMPEFMGIDKAKSERPTSARRRTPTQPYISRKTTKLPSL